MVGLCSAMPPAVFAFSLVTGIHTGRAVNAAGANSGDALSGSADSGDAQPRYIDSGYFYPGYAKSGLAGSGGPRATRPPPLTSLLRWLGRLLFLAAEVLFLAAGLLLLAMGLPPLLSAAARRLPPSKAQALLYRQAAGVAGGYLHLAHAARALLSANLGPEIVSRWAGIGDAISAHLGHEIASRWAILALNTRRDPTSAPLSSSPGHVGTRPPSGISGDWFTAGEAPRLALAPAQEEYRGGAGEEEGGGGECELPPAASRVADTAGGSRPPADADIAGGPSPPADAATAGEGGPAGGADTAGGGETELAAAAAALRYMAAGARRQAAAALAAHRVSQGLRKASAEEREAKMAVVRGLQAQVGCAFRGGRVVEV